MSIIKRKRSNSETAELPEMQQELLEVMNAHKRIEAISAENDQLKEQLSVKQQLLARLHKVTLASATLLGSVDSSASGVEPSALQCLVNIVQSIAVVPQGPEEAQDNGKLMIGKYLNQVLAVIADSLRPGKEEQNIVTVLQLAMNLKQLFEFAEEKGLIPETESGKGWKKGMETLDGLMNKLRGDMNAAEDEE